MYADWSEIFSADLNNNDTEYFFLKELLSDQSLSHFNLDMHLPEPLLFRREHFECCQCISTESSPSPNDLFLTKIIFRGSGFIGSLCWLVVLDHISDLLELRLHARLNSPDDAFN